MNEINITRRLLAVLLLGVVTIARAQAPDLPGALPSHQGVTEGRSVTLFAEGATGAVQWQYATNVDGTWANVVDDATHHGATTMTLEIAAANAASTSLVYRFTSTASGLTSTSNNLVLMVSSLLFPQPSGMIVDGSGGLLVTDSATQTIGRITNARDFVTGKDVNCVFTVFAGVPNIAGDHNEDAPTSNFNQPNGLVRVSGGVAVGDVLVADTANATIRLISVYTVTTLAGSSTARGNVDGAGPIARFGAPTGIAHGTDGFYYITDSTNHTIRKMRGDGNVSTLAGSPGNAGFADGVGADARFNSPSGIAIDDAGNIYVADTMNNLIRKITAAGAVTSLAGVAGIAGARDGAGAQALFNGPTGLAVSPDGKQLYVADTGNSTIRVIDSTGTVATIAGLAGVSGMRDGSSHADFNGLLNQPKAITFDEQGILFIADTGNAAIRALTNYDGTLVTILVNVAPVSAPPPTSTPPPSTPTPASTTSASSSGGGAFDAGSIAVLAGLALLRFRRRLIARNSSFQT